MLRATLLFSFLAACGTSEPEMSFATAIQWAPQVECSTGEADLGLNMQALLEIGGHNPCELAINPTTLEASGQCERITIGIVRPLALGYFYPDASDELIALAYVIGWVDLEKDALGDSTNVNVQLSGDNVTWVDTDDELGALPAEEDCNGLTDEMERRLCIAEAWAKKELARPVGSRPEVDFDEDNDTEINIVEACNGTLLD